jgi:hypothetical protein
VLATFLVHALCGAPMVVVQTAEDGNRLDAAFAMVRTSRSLSRVPNRRGACVLLTGAKAPKGSRFVVDLFVSDNRGAGSRSNSDLDRGESLRT